MPNHRIKEVIKEKSTTIDAIAKQIGVKPSAISQSISGNPTLERLQQIADALGVDITELFAKESDFTAFVKEGDKVYHFASFRALKAYTDTK